jgi:D-glycero-alpha-D-manno-heptose-7-phosphate kinase
VLDLVISTASEIALEQQKMTPHKKRELYTMLPMVGEAENVVLNAGRPRDEFGRLLHESWQLKRWLRQKISNPDIDEIYQAGLSAGALGGKLLGAGGGGFMLFFVPPDEREALRLRLKKLLCVPFTFSAKSSEVAVYEPE